MNTAIFSRTGGNIGIGFAIPSNMVKAVMTQLIQYGEVKRGMLGVTSARDITPAIAESLGLESTKGALVGQVVEGSPAEKAGIKAGDVITSINGRASRQPVETRNTIGMLRIGEKVDIGLIRDGKPRRVTAVIGERGAPRARGAGEVHSGVRRRDARQCGRTTPASSSRASPKAARPRNRPAHERRDPRGSAACASRTSSSCAPRYRIAVVRDHDPARELTRVSELFADRLKSCEGLVSVALFLVATASAGERSLSDARRARERAPH